MNRQLSSGAGVLFVVISMSSAFILGQSPSYDESGATIVEWHEDNGSRYLITHTIAGLAFLLLYFPFLAGLTEALQVAEGNSPVWSRVAWAGGLMCPAIGTARGLFATAPALLGGEVSPDIASFAMAAAAYGLIVSGAMAGVLTGAAAIVILKTRVFAPWLGWLAITTSLATIVSVTAIIERDPSGPLSFLNSLGWELFFLWILVASVSLWRRPDGPHNAS